ncbi:MAG: AMIN domain-containing protein, partial [Myxococcaceae bacterium]|nr:AMIN domain-containing protein [Myxococcaceae bacterium]
VALAWAWPAPAPVLPPPGDGPGALDVLSAVPKAQEALAAMVAPAEEAVDQREAPAPDDGVTPEPVDPRAAEAEAQDEGSGLARASGEDVVRPAVGTEVAGVEAGPRDVPPPTPGPSADPVPGDGPAAPGEPPREQAAPADPPSPRHALGDTDPGTVARRGNAPSRSAPLARGQLSLPTGAALALEWQPSPDGLDVRPALRADTHVARVFSLSSPPRVVFDIEGAAPRKSHTATPGDDALVSRVRLGKQGARTRVVVDLSSEPRRVIAAGDHAIVQF